MRPGLEYVPVFVSTKCLLIHELDLLTSSICSRFCDPQQPLHTPDSVREEEEPSEAADVAGEDMNLLVYCRVVAVIQHVQV